MTEQKPPAAIDSAEQPTLLVADHLRLEQFARDADDLRMFIAEFARVLVRVNPVSAHAYQLRSRFMRIDACTSPEQIVDMVRRSLIELDLSDLRAIIADYDLRLRTRLTAAIRAYVTGLEDSEEGGPAWAAQGAGDIVSSMRSLRGRLVPVGRHYSDLMVGLDRYVQVMAEPLEVAKENVAGWFHDVRLILAHGVWQNWSSADDPTYAAHYSRGVAHVMEELVDFAARTEELAEVSINELMRNVRSAFDERIENFRERLHAGENPEMIYRQFSMREDPGITSRELLRVVLRNLQASGVGQRSVAYLNRLVLVPKSQVT